MTEAITPLSGANELALKAEIARLNKMIQALMNRAERNASLQGSAFNLFQTAVTLEDQVRHRTQELDAALQENQKITRALRESENKYRLLADNVDDVIFIQDMNLNYTYVSPSVKNLIGYEPEEVLEQPLSEILTPSSLDRVMKTLSEDLELEKSGKRESSPLSRTIQLEMTRKDGTTVWVESKCNFFRDDDQRLMGILGVTRDITRRKASEEKIQQMAFHDALTGLPNRKLFSDRLGIALVQAKRNQKKVGIAMLDLDNFKVINDTLGHDMGDLLLKVATERLSGELRKGDTVARFGGDEFLLILPDLNLIEDAIGVAQKIVDSFDKPFLIDTHQLAVTTSIGIAVYPDDGTEEGILLKNADIAMYQAKQAGRARYRIYKNTSRRRTGVTLKYQFLSDQCDLEDLKW